MSLIIPANTLAASGYAVDNSCRFNGTNDSLNLTTGTPTDAKKFTFSTWLKKCKNGVEQDLMAYNPSGNAESMIRIDDSDRFVINDRDASDTDVEFFLVSNAVLRDASAWYNLIVAVDTTDGTNTNRVKMYINGTQVTSLQTATYPEQNITPEISAGSRAVYVGARVTSQFFNGYLAETVFIDGQQLAADSFGEFDSDSGIWKPIDVSGLTFGDNGFYFEYSDSSDLGVNSKGTDWTPNNLAAIDQSTDTCTTNFCTLNSISEHNNSTFSDGNLTYTGSAAAVHNAIGSIGVTQGKWYFEAKRVAGASAYPFVGVFNADGTMGSYLGQTVDGWSILMDAADNGEWRNNATLSGTSVGAFVNGDIGMVAIDMDNGKIWFGRNGTWGDSGNPSAGSGEQYSNLTGTIIPAVAVYTGAAISLNFGSPPYSESGGETDGNGYGNFAHAVPTNYYSLNTKNLAEYG